MITLTMRIDKYLKVSRLIKRRTIAKQVADSGYILINGKKAKPADEVKEGDELVLHLGKRNITIHVLSLVNKQNKNEVKLMYEILEDNKS